MLDVREPWWHDAVCAEIGTDLFFLAFGEPGTEAKAACRMCPVRLNCLLDAVEGDLEHGIFGGFGRESRRHIIGQIEAGADPFEACLEAIEKDQEINGYRTRTTSRLRRPRRRRAVAGLHGVPAGRAEERPDLAAPSVRPEGLGLRRRNRRSRRGPAGAAD